ncbi:hypothetical protein CTI12_AA567880 [Artemisia annua]|uniref:Uncharacterized protein n=1 Tax=Artemisia annua TaxID=35608 RepID=A0A2U1KSN9_ARTAN|nr:hypothetical protein CTI12_AA567880 [Artemisia annua]
MKGSPTSDGASSATVEMKRSSDNELDEADYDSESDNVFIDPEFGSNAGPGVEPSEPKAESVVNSSAETIQKHLVVLCTEA